MTVESKQIIQKMINELEQAKEKHHQHVKMKRHIASVKVLCELMLEESSASSVNNHQEITDGEMLAMMGKSQPPKNSANPQQLKQFGQSSKKDLGSSDSLFDF